MFETNNNKKKLLIMVGIFILTVVLCVGVYVLLVYEPKDEVETPIETTDIPTPQQIEETPDVIIEDKQGDATSILKARVLSLIDNTATVQYTVSIGSEDKASDSKILANTNTIVYDASIERVVGVNGVKENMEVLFYGVGNYKVGNLVADAIVIGGNSNIRFGALTEIYKENDDLYVGKILDTSNYINITKDTRIENGYTGMYINDLKTIKPNSLIFYVVEPEFKQTQDGLFYDVNKIIIVSDGEKRE